MKPKTELIKLDGTLIKSDGTQKKSKFFDFLDIDIEDYSNITYTAEEAAKVRAHMMHLSTGASAAIPLICSGPKCPFYQKCPFKKLTDERKKVDPQAKSALPLGLPCLVEKNLLNEWTRLYMTEYEIDDGDFTEFMMVRELAEIELMLWRLNNNISKPEHAELVQETVVGIDKEGNRLTRLEINAFMEAKDRLQNRKSKIIKLMVGDRQEKYKREAALKVRETNDPSSNSAKLRGQIDRLLAQAKTLDIKVKETEGKVIDVDIEEHNISQPAPLTPEDLINGSDD